MITGELKSQVDKVWEAFWTGGVSNPLSVIEQFTYLLFVRRLDERQLLEEKKANMIGVDALVEKLSNQRIVSALEEGNTLKLRGGRIREEHIEDNRNNRYLDWTSEQLVDKIDEKIQLIKNIKEGTVAATMDQVENTNVGLILSNIYYRMKLLAKFLRD